MVSEWLGKLCVYILNRRVRKVSLTTPTGISLIEEFSFTSCCFSLKPVCVLEIILLLAVCLLNLVGIYFLKCIKIRVIVTITRSWDWRFPGFSYRYSLTDLPLASEKSFELVFDLPITINSFLADFLNNMFCKSNLPNGYVLSNSDDVLLTEFSVWPFT